jgi:hypothetical protein
VLRETDPGKPHLKGEQSMKTQAGLTLRDRHLFFVASLFAGLALSVAIPVRLPAQTAADQASAAWQAADKPTREAWRKEMTRKGLPKNGCFTIKYPDTSWHEVACLPPSKYPNPPQAPAGKQPNTVGNLSGDWDAQTAGSINTAEGSFISVNGAATVDDFMLQINTQRFNTTSNNCNNHPGCQGWQQFLWSPTQNGGSGGVFIEYWLLNYGPCPAGPWITSAPHCWFNGPMTGANATIANLPNMTLTATATAGGQDTAVFNDGAGNLTANGQDNVLNLAGAWTTAEFNVFGDCCGQQTNFSNPTTLDVKTTINDGTTNAPACFNGSFTGETNNLTLANITGTGTQVCCPYGGATPAVEFMETNAGHTAVCGPTQIEGDPHITTADGTHYDFQGAGEFVSLRDREGMEIQTRQAPIATTFFPGPDAHDGLATCVSLNSAVAARVGKHRVTYEPDLSGVPNPSGLQLRIDGALTTLRPQGIDFGDGGRISPQGSPGALEIDFPNGRTLFVTPQWWASQSKWYLNVDVTHLGIVNSDGGGSSSTALGGSSSTALGGIAGPMATGSWLPALPNGSSLGPMPSSLQDRYNALYRKFADGWRVTDKDSLFDYAAGTSTNTFTMRDWPLQQPPCRVPETKPVPPLSEEVAAAACRFVSDAKRHADCVFDVRVAGDVGFAKLYMDTQRLMTDSTIISLKDDPNPSQVGEFVEFTAFVAANSAHPTGVPSGTVQFTVDGAVVGAPVLVDGKGRALYGTSQLKAGKHHVSAAYLPAADTSFLPSSSLEVTHLVQRCHCDRDRAYVDHREGAKQDANRRD